MDNPAWEDTQPVQAEALRAPASADSSAPPAWEDTSPAPESEAPSWDETTDLQSQYGTPGQQALAGLEGIGRGVLGPVFTGAESLLGGNPTAMRLREEANPWTAGLSEAGSFAATTALTLGTSAEARAALEAGEIASKAAQGTSTVAKIAKYGTVPGLVGQLGEKAGAAAPFLKTSARLATELAALQGGSEISKAIEQDPNQTAQSAVNNVLLSGLIGGVAGVPLGMASSAWEKLSGPTAQRILSRIKTDWGMGDALPKEDQIVSPNLKKVLSLAVPGMSQDLMEEYAAQRDLIRAAPEFPEVYGHALDHILDMQDNLETKKATVAEAKAGFDKFLDEQKLSLRQQGYDAAAADRVAKQAAKEASDRIAIGLQACAQEASSQAFSAVQKLRTDALAKSAGAMEILENTPGTLSLKPIYDAVNPMMQKLYEQGFPERAKALGDVINNFAQQYGDEAGFPQVKRMVQGLQQRGNWSFGANEIANGLTPYFNSLSGRLNDMLKTAVKPYGEAMLPTADSFALLNKLDRYATPERALKSAVAIDKPVNYAIDMPVLKELEQKTGINFTDRIEQYANPEVREKMVQATPEYQRSVKTAKALQELKDPETQAALQRAPYLSQAAQKLEAAKSALEAQQERMVPLKGINENTLEGKLKTVMAGKNMAAMKALKNIPGMETMGDMTIPEILNLIRVREAFEKGAMNGSRNVNLFANIGRGLGGLAGAIFGHGITGGYVGGSIGGIIGGSVDKEGPDLVRAALDRYLDKFGDLPKAFGTDENTAKAGLLHFLGRDVPPDAKAFKSTINYLGAIKAAGQLTKSAVGSIFDGSKTVPNHIWTSIDSVKKLDEKTKALKGNEQGLLHVGGGLGHYMPEHGQALSQMAANAVNYINQNRPMTQQDAPMDEPMDPTPEQEYAFHRGLELADQPMSIIKRIKDDTILPEDVQHLAAMYPAYYQHMKNEITDAMTQHLSDGKTIPYNLRQNLSVFLGETLDSSMSPPNIMAAQNVFATQRAAAMPAPASKTEKLAKASQSYQTKDQSALSRNQAPA